MASRSLPFDDGAPTRSNCEIVVDALDWGDIGLLALERTTGTPSSGILEVDA